MKMMNGAAVIAALATVAALGGCANTATLTYLPSGETGFAINTDKASYSNVRRFLNMNTTVPPASLPAGYVILISEMPRATLFRSISLASDFLSARSSNGIAGTSRSGPCWMSSSGWELSGS